jgi:hypothetical protein
MVRLNVDRLIKLRRKGRFKRLELYLSVEGCKSSCADESVGLGEVWMSGRRWLE